MSGGGQKMSKFRYVRHRLSEKLELPEDALGAAYRLQMIRDCVLIGGCRKILKYKPDEITAAASGADISVRGAHLKCVYFFEGTIEVRGDVTEIGIAKK